MSRRLLFVFATAMFMALTGCSSHKSVTNHKRKPVRTEQVRHVDNKKEKKGHRVTTDAKTAQLIEEARKWVGVPYLYGGSTRSGVDCSGLMCELFMKVYNLKLPRSSAAQQQYCEGVGRDDLQPGDLVFFATGRSNAVSHVGLYIGDDRMIHASGSRGVMESGLEEPYYIKNYHSGGRVVRQLSKTPEKAVAKAAPAPASAPAPAPPALLPLEIKLNQLIDSIYVSDPGIFD